jgi:hypothetical protein
VQQINCYIPIKVCITGRLGDAQLEQLGETLMRALAERIAFAERTIAAHHGQPLGGDFELLKEDYDPAREDAAAEGYYVPSYDGHGQRRSIPVRRQMRGRPWFIRRAINFHAYVGQFLDLVEKFSAQSLGLEVYADFFSEQRWVSLWLVQVNQPLHRDKLKSVLIDRALQLSRVRSNQVLFTVFSRPGDEEMRQLLIEIDQDHLVAREIPNLARQTGSVTPGKDVHRQPTAWLLFASMVLPEITLKDRADLGAEIQVPIRLRDLTFLVNPVSTFDRFERRFFLSWEAYLREFGDNPATVHFQPTTVRKRTNFLTLKTLVEQAVRQRIDKQLASGPETAFYGDLNVLNDATLGQWPAAVRDHAYGITDDLTRRLDKTQVTLEPNWKAAYVYTVLTISPQTIYLARDRPEASAQADRLIPILRERLVTEDERKWAFIDFLNQNYSSLFPTKFEVLLDELKRRDNGRWFDRLFQATEEAHDFDRRLLVINLAKQTKYANDPQVLDLISAHNKAHQTFLSNEYNAEDQEIILKKLFGDKTVIPGNVLHDIWKPYVHEEERYRPKSFFIPIWETALLRERYDLLERIEKGEDPQGLGNGYTDTEFADAVVHAVFSRVNIPEHNYGDYFETVTVQFSVRFLGLKKERDALGIETVWVFYRIVQRVGGGDWDNVGDILQVTDSEFDYKIERWVHEQVSSVIITIAHIALGIAAIGVAWEFGIVQALIRIGGGARVVIGNMLLSAILEGIINGFTFENFLSGAIDGYLGALFFRGAGVLARGFFGPSITTLSFRKALLPWIGVQVFKGTVGGGSSAAAIRFTHDVYLVGTGRGKWSTPAEYAKSIGLGAAMGTGAEIAGPILVEPVLERFMGSAADVARLLRANGISARWASWSDQVLSKMRQNLGGLMENQPEKAATISDGFEILFEQVDEASTNLDPGIPGRAQRIVQASNPAEVEILEAGRGDALPSLEQIDAELSIVERSPSQKIPGGEEYIEKVELSNDHTWRRKPDGSWCRFSNGKICTLPSRGKRRVAPGQTIRSEQDIDKFLEPARPSLDSPPASVKKPYDREVWQIYNDYFEQRVRDMRNDIRATGKTTKNSPWEFTSFRKQINQYPRLLDALRGRLYQGRIAPIIDDITSGKAAHNLGISDVPNPAPDQVRYPDTVFHQSNSPPRDGFTAVSKKSRDFRKVKSTAKRTSAEVYASSIRKIVIGDIRDAYLDYYGFRYVLRKGLDVTGTLITIDEIVLNYDLGLVPDAEIRKLMQATAKAYGGVNVKIGFFTEGTD